MGIAAAGGSLCINHFAIEFLQQFQKGKLDLHAITTTTLLLTSKFLEFIIRYAVTIIHNVFNNYNTIILLWKIHLVLIKQR